MKKQKHSLHQKSPASRLEITRAENGFMLHQHHESKNGEYNEPTKTVHENSDSLMKSIKKAIGAGSGGSDFSDKARMSNQKADSKNLRAVIVGNAAKKH